MLQKDSQLSASAAQINIAKSILSISPWHTTKKSGLGEGNVSEKNESFLTAFGEPTRSGGSVLAMAVG